MNIKNQMAAAAANIYPGKSLAALCVSYPPGQKRPAADRQALYNMLWSGSFYLDPYWLSTYYPIGNDALIRIKLSNALNVAA